LNHLCIDDLPEREGQLGAEAAAKPEATYPDARLDELGATENGN
jgi:hypothetical protein